MTQSTIIKPCANTSVLPWLNWFTDNEILKLFPGAERVERMKIAHSEPFWTAAKERRDLTPAELEKVGLKNPKNPNKPKAAPAHKSAEVHEMECLTDLGMKGFYQGLIYQLHIARQTDGRFSVFNADTETRYGGYAIFQDENDLLNNFKYTNPLNL
jgi:hypothetical protein